MATFPDYAAGGATDWTRGYRAAWFYLRSGMAWTLIGWALVLFPASDPSRVRVARALRPIAKDAAA